MKHEETGPFLNELCDLAATQTMPRFRGRNSVSNKLGEGFDPVTEADREAERVIRDRIAETFPDHGILGEEFGEANKDAEFCWIVDPVDGTRAFISGLPTWGTLIGLYRHGVPFAGIMCQPFTGERYLCDGLGSRLTRNGEVSPLKTSAKTKLADAILLSTYPEFSTEFEQSRFDKVKGQCKLTRHGTDCYGYCMVASGNADLVVEAGVQTYDVAALIPIVEKAGGVFTNWEGGSPANGGRVIAAANRDLHEQALALLV